MKKFFFILVFLPLISFSQGMPSNSINWISLSEGEKYSEKYKKNMLIYFYRNNCDYCKRMKDEVLTDPQIVKLINENFFPVKLDGKTKKSIEYHGKNYINDVSIEEDPKSSWRHNLFFELVTPTKGNFYWPTIVIIDGEDKKVAQLPGFRSRQQLLRSVGQVY